MTIIAAADGSALGNPGPAGWAWTVDSSTWRCGGWERGTNNQGELTAVLDLLRQTAHTGEDLHVYCDSQYVINSVTKWMAGWKRKGWKKADGKPVLNVELMRALDEAMAGRTVRFEWVRGHAGHPLNEAADTLANGAARAMSAGRPVESGPGYPGATAVGAGDDPAAPPAAGGRAPRRRAVEAPDLFTPADDGGSAGDEAPDDGEAVVADPGAEVLALERELLAPTFLRDRTRLTRVLDLRWRLVDADGRAVTRRELVGDPGPLAGLELSRPEPRVLSADVVQVHWTGTRGAERTVRTSTWQRDGETWKQVHQQATRVS